MAVPKDWQARFIQLLSVPGMLVAYYLLLYHSGSLFTTCTVNEWFDCGQVSGPASPYASIGPIPVALIGVMGYGSIFLVIWLKEWISFVKDYLPELLAGIIGIAFLFTLGLTVLELLVIHAFCQFCLYSAAIVTAMFILAVSYMISSRRTRT
ncbi:MAG: vitamin K epoxide reductase family protein [Candidatus Promineifilaceae bacterium]|nr:vitamin K epoxide reductase family protein [Candidatus Promineifilaceae bacterium]